MPGCSTGHNHHPLHSLESCVIISQILQINIALLFLKTACNGIPYCTGLLVDLLQHKMLVATLFCHQWRPINMTRLFFQVLSGNGGKTGFTAIKNSHFPIFHKNHLTGVSKNSRNVRSNKKFTLPQTNHHW